MNWSIVFRELKFFTFFVIGYIPVFLGVMYVIQEEPKMSYFYQGMLVAFIVTYVVRTILFIMKSID
ncbi:hypothetical protein KMW28_16260 [Flammeovirga yaeyamensis]|uniref:Uncharacterized protein n=1 Tax=Flammeovirga yaeyamensis TaxID=367791 RepID=A0AAX1N148_9BACT|nr:MULTISPECIES: hypothetical protein [Flammeovirga]ANQ47390.1 hypothetical protein MY04_0005 [Flammeovirga sp. MY04]MBB3698435.1 hypothetical protein [Flammeovirga yaeyamensis]NMF34215.1 hypothetical protein [Flammeovirga yaeyamensis]QWG01200.1 hypothetical protein KMW28_16260 [Flammeovirga yaeyamensis]